MLKSCYFLGKQPLFSYLEGTNKVFVTIRKLNVINLKNQAYDR